MTSNELIILILTGAVVLGTIILYILMFIGNKNFYVICSLYKERFGYLPFNTELFYKSSPFFISGYDIKMSFIISPLIFNKKCLASSNDCDVEFIKSLPKKLTRIYVVTFYFSIPIAISFIVAVIMAYLNK
ncbi:hypothetical protein [Citrobacter braakii]|uniref:hypothetical protein n=1 Tax=Citrobacter braakii TaxID=57706 RepID=UPI001378CF07|nr:hypothetical protein [Citrobacter braakii]MEB8014205.1 hypothetical protein [Citrobacter braakii]NCL82723.1 hypothetical protein [Citrobacter braakii]HEB0897292.1 hypothetical protein [Citrobacter braakii]